MYVWYLRKSEQFEDWGDVFAAWLQNLLGNVITFQKLHDKIEAADQAGNVRESYYWYGRFTTLFINFEPIKEDDFEDEEFEDPTQELLTRVPTSRINPANEDYNISKDLDVLVRQSPRVRGLFGSALGFTAGYMNASLGNASPNAGICQTNLTRIVESAEDLHTNVKDASEPAL